MYILKTNNLTKKYGNHIVVNNVNMSIEKGDVYGFVGENGAGKTTIIRLVTGLISPTSGSYTLFDIDSNSKEILSARKKVAGVVEKISVSPALSAEDNLRYQAIVCNKELSLEDIKTLLSNVGLNYEEIKDKKAGNFSLGMRQRLGIALCLISNPEIILLDEPMNGVDPKGIHEIREVIMNLSKKGITFLVSSHILSELEKICNKIGFITHGKLLKEISMDELRKQSGKQVVIGFNNTSDLEKTISLLDIKDKEVTDNTLKIFDDLDINNILNILVSNNISINSINVKNETIEDYYLRLMGGRNNG